MDPKLKDFFKNYSVQRRFGWEMKASNTVRWQNVVIAIALGFLALGIAALVWL